MKAAKWNRKRIQFVLTVFLSALLLTCASNRAALEGLSGSLLKIPVDIAGIVHAGQTNTEKEYALLDKLGASWVLNTFYWSRIEQKDNQWNFYNYDMFVNTAKKAGKKVIGVLAYDVSWIHNDGKSHNYIPPDKIPFFLDYVRQTAAHFRGRVDAWCIWNEPNFIFWHGSMDEFLVLARYAADAVREVDPDVILLGGAFNRGIFDLPTAFIRGLFESGAMKKVDAVAFHPYELNPDRMAKIYGKFRAIAAEYGFGDRIWITEVGYPTGGWYPSVIPEKKFPAYIVKTFVSLAVSGANKIFWYQLFDPAVRKKSNSEHFFGLVRNENDYTSKGAEAFRLCAVHLAGTVYRPELPLREGLPSSLHSFYFEPQPSGASREDSPLEPQPSGASREGSPLEPQPSGAGREGSPLEQAEGGGTLVLWKDGVSMRLWLEIPDGSTMHDPVSGNASAIPAETLITVGSTPVFITWRENKQKMKIKLSGRR